MRHEEIEHHLGADVAKAISDSVKAAYVVAASPPDATRKIEALRWHLIGLIAATITRPHDEDNWRDNAATCGERLVRLVEEVCLGR